MRKYLFILVIMMTFPAGMTGRNAGEVSLRSLLQEMVDRDALARYPETFYLSRQASSYDRRTVAKDKNEWFANVDRSQFIRVEKKNGRKEYVMMESSAPGAIVRFWMNFAGPESGKGTLRIYLDGSDTAVIEGSVLSILIGRTACICVLS